MIPLTITTDIRKTPWSDVDPQQWRLGTIVRIGRLPRGTTSGKPTVTVLVDFLDGTPPIGGQTTLALLEAAVKALRAAEDRDNQG